MSLLAALQPRPPALLGAFQRPLLAGLAAPRPWELRGGRYQDSMQDVVADALIADPPYSERTHKGQHVDSTFDNAARRTISYAHFTPADIDEFLDFWCPRVRGWMAIMSCSDLMITWNKAAEKRGRVVFAPVPCVIRGMTVRLAGDGPSSWAVYLNVSRPRSREWCDGTRPGAYVVGRGGRNHIGGKPLDLMLQIVNHYSRPGALIVDPTAGWATTGIAALGLGRRFIGSEVEEPTRQVALQRLAAVDGNEVGKMRARLEALKKAKGTPVLDEPDSIAAQIA